MPNTASWTGTVGLAGPKENTLHGGIEGWEGSRGETSPGLGVETEGSRRAEPVAPEPGSLRAEHVEMT